MEPRKLPVIGITSNILKDSSGMFPGYSRAYVNEDYIISIVRNGGIPIILPLNGENSVLKEQMSLLDGLILSGGSDISPLKYGEEPYNLLGEIMPARDDFDMKLLDYAIQKGIPILGICRGMQIMNVYHGGTLYQDNSYHSKNVLKHWQGHGTDIPTHHVSLHKDSTLYKIYNKETICVNSFHHQSIKELGKGLKITARSKDGIIEGIESTYYPFMIGVQWHPEMLCCTEENSNRIFATFIKKSIRRKGI